MEFVKLQYKPGIVKDVTQYGAMGSYINCDKIRFHHGFPESIGGWQKAVDSQFDGTCRMLHMWASLSSETLIALGTHLKLYLLQGGTLYNITPIRATQAGLTDPFTTSSGSTTVTVADTAHGAQLNDFVTFSGATGFNGVATDTLNAEHQITAIVDANNYQIVVADTASGSGSGGGTVAAEYQLTTGQEGTLYGLGWGAGSWSRNTWSSPADEPTQGQILRLWSMDNFGEDLIVNPRLGSIYYYDTSAGGEAADLSTLSTASNTPTACMEVMVSDTGRQVIAFGVNPLGESELDPLFIRWSAQEDAGDWTPTTTNAAGGLRIPNGSTFVTALKTKQEILIWTDASLHSMSYVGTDYIYGIQLISKKMNIIAPNAKTAVGEKVFWMGYNQMYMYDGRVTPMNCPVSDYVFDDINRDQIDKVFCGSNSSFNEVWWHYPSADSEENDRYLIYNYVEDVWYYGMLDRTSWHDKGITQYPLATDSNGYLYYHEIGIDDGSTMPVSPINAYVEAAPLELGEGHNFMFISRLIPDITFANSTEGNPSATFTLKPRDYPGIAYHTSDDGTVTRSATTPVEAFTEQVYVRLRCRSVALRVESNATGVAWRLGTPRIEVRTDGRR